MKIKTQVMIFAIVSLFMISCNKSEIYYNRSFDEISSIAKNENKSFCFAVVNDTCNTIYSEYLSKLEKYGIKNKAIVNIVKSSDNWYLQWLGSNNPIVTCLFSPDGMLEATIAGNSSYSFKFLEEALSGNFENAGFGFRPLFDQMDDDARMSFLDQVLKCKIDLDNNIPIDKAVDNTLEITRYPFNVYLKLLSEQAKDQHSDATRHYAEVLRNFETQIHYYGLYSDLFEYAEPIIDPEYTFENRPVLLLDNHEIRLADCHLNQAKPFEVRVANTGKTDLFIKTVDLGCNCVQLVSEEIPVVEPGSFFDIQFEFTPDSEGEVTRKVMILSNAQNKLETITIKALSK